MKTEKSNESFVDKIIDRIFGRIRKSQEEKACVALEADPEYQKAKNRLEDVTKEAEQHLEYLAKKYPHLAEKWK